MIPSVPAVVVVGSANMDLVARVNRFPLPGETITGLDFHTFSGGKGANQASAIARLGGKPSFVGKVGNDSFGLQIISRLRQAGVDTSHVFAEQDIATGTAMILVAENGENSIVVSSGANSFVDSGFVAERLSRLEFKTVLAQLETPIGALVECKKRAHKLILNPAPANDLPLEIYRDLHWITPNETETEILTGIRPTAPDLCRDAAMAMLDRGVQNVAITLGAAGCYFANASHQEHIPSIQVESVDSTAAGDAFSGALAHFLNLDYDPIRAIRIANRAGALTTTKLGAQSSLPNIAELEAVCEGLI